MSESTSHFSRRDVEVRPTAIAGEYTVRPGDTLYSIAFRHQLDYHELAAWNHIGPDYRIFPGRVLRLSPPHSAVARATIAEPVPVPPPSRPVAVSAPLPSPVPQIPVTVASKLSPSAPAAVQAPVAASVAAPAAMMAPPVKVEVPPASASAPLMGPPADAAPAGPLQWQWPAAGKIVREFGDDGSKGIDIGGAEGDVVVAAAPGKVVYSGGALKGYGELVIIKHDEQYLSAYGYNRRRLVEEGSFVAAGQPVAELGQGPEQIPLLHFEIRDKGRPIDPMTMLPRR